ncbi:CLUMA_CG003826, isoform A [Clunio marinus]|uniref:CLUMA_CG003826, isoform A n=1 Tax=Clunio marinus TaxID=568069 RepID=A0A1J1HRU5_9DIPT|nr:CLUMA_CG003826, isoform A [Clunio marinus]
MPFTKKNCHNTSPLLVNEFKNKKFSKSVKDFFPNKFGNLHGCEIRAAISDESEPAVFVAHTKHNKLKVSGRDIRLLQGLSEVMKFSLNFTYVGHSGYFFANGTSKGPLKALLNKEADLSISDWYLKEHRAAFFQNSVPYFSEKLVFVVPPGKPLSPIEKLIYPMTLHAWILLLTCYSFGLVVIFVVGRSSIKYQHFVFGRDKQKPYLNMFAAFIGVSDHALPKRTFARFLLMMFLIFSLVIRSFYQGSFYQLLKSNKHHLKVQTIDEMIKKDFTFYVYSGLSDLFQGTEGIKRRLVKISIEDKISYANRILNNPEFLGALGDSMTMIAFHNQKMSEDFRYLICHDVVLIAPIVMYTLKDFYLLNEINSNIDVFTAAGLVDLWHYRDIDKQALKIKSFDNPKVLSLIQLTGCFQVLIFGYSISLIIFMGEILLRSFSNTTLINYMEA